MRAGRSSPLPCSGPRQQIIDCLRRELESAANEQLHRFAPRITIEIQWLNLQRCAALEGESAAQLLHLPRISSDVADLANPVPGVFRRKARRSLLRHGL